MSEHDQVNAPPAAAEQPATPAAAPVDAAIAKLLPSLSTMDADQLLQLAAGVNWKGLDLEAPAACTILVGAEPVDLRVVIVCDCDTKIRLNLGAEKEVRCPKCGTVFRHLLLIEAEDDEESAAGLAVEAILDANR